MSLGASLIVPGTSGAAEQVLSSGTLTGCVCIACRPHLPCPVCCPPLACLPRCAPLPHDLGFLGPAVLADVHDRLPHVRLGHTCFSAISSADPQLTGSKASHNVPCSTLQPTLTETSGAVHLLCRLTSHLCMRFDRWLMQPLLCRLAVHFCTLRLLSGCRPAVHRRLLQISCLIPEHT